MAILSATRESLAEVGLDRTTIRGIAARAGVDAALVHHYFGTKRELVGHALQPPIDVAAAVGGPIDGPGAGADFIRRAVTLWDGEPRVREHLIGMLRVALVNPDVAEVLQNIQRGIVTAVLGAAVRSDSAPLRCALIGSQMTGLAMMRYVARVPEIVAADADELAEAMGPTVRHYLTGDLGVGNDNPVGPSAP